MECHIRDISYLISSSAQFTQVLTCCWRVLANSTLSVKLLQILADERQKAVRLVGL